MPGLFGMGNGGLRAASSTDGSHGTVNLSSSNEWEIELYRD